MKQAKRADPGAVERARLQAERNRVLNPRLYTVSLACGHTNDFPNPPPKPGDTAFCRRCDSFTRVTKGES